CYEPADPGHGMTDETIDSVWIADDRFGRDGNEGEIGEHGKSAYHEAPDAGTGRAWRRPGDQAAAVPRRAASLDRSFDRHQSCSLSGRRPARRGLDEPA